MIAKLAYLTTPAPNRFLLNFQSEGSDGILSVEITKAHLAGILITGTDLALRAQANSFSIHRVPVASHGGAET